MSLPPALAGGSCKAREPGREQRMKPIKILIAVLSFVVVTIVSNASLSTASQQIPKESKEQPTKVKLDTDSVDDKWGEVPFHPTTHPSTNSTLDGTSPARSLSCHHAA